jgi:hypothetical protein
LSEVTHPSVVPPVGVVVEVGLIPCTPKVYPKEWDRSTSPTVCIFEWPKF